MSNSSIVCGTGTGTAVTDNTTRYVSLGQMVEVTATESVVESPVRDAGVFSKLFVYVSGNAVVATTVITLRKSRVATALTVSYTSTQTGIKEDNVNTVSFAATDEVDYEVAAAASAGTVTITPTLFGCQFAPTTPSDCVTFMVASRPTGITLSAASTTGYSPCSGRMEYDVTEASFKYRIRAACVASDLFVNVSTNARTTDTVFRSRKNGANGNQVVTYTSGQTGQKEDTTNTDSLAIGDDYNYSCTTSTGTGNIVVFLTSSTLVNTLGMFYLQGDSPNVAHSFNLTHYCAVSGGRSGNATTEANAQYRPQFTFTAKEFGALVLTNTIATSATTIKFRVSGANGNQALSYAAGETGVKFDSVNTDLVTANSTLINYQIVTPNTSGSIIFSWIGALGLIPALSRPKTYQQAVNRAAIY